MEGIYNSDIKYITVDETGDNFVCELCNFAVQNNLKTPRKNIAYEFKNNKKIKRDIYKHLKGYSDFHANLIEIHYAPSIRSGIILNYGGYEYNEDTEKSEQKNAAFTKYYHCNKTRCNCRARIVNNQFSFSNNHVCNSNNFLNDIRAQYPNLLHGNPAYRTQFDEDHNIAMNLHYEQIRDQQSDNAQQNIGGSSSSQHHTGASSYTNQPLDSQYQPSHFQQHTPGIDDDYGSDPDYNSNDD
uniref:DUF3800 domain-containing protein n=1 Tax=Meloidogyne hapla TaxID=6305 RepID=A0A1I8C0E7_MELHA